MFEQGRVFTFISLIIIMGIILLEIVRTRGGAKVTIRTIAGVAAIEEAIGRATEMGRPIHYCPGAGDLYGGSSPQTLAGLQILSYVTRTAARYSTRLIVTTSMPDTYVAADEVVKQGYIESNRPDGYVADDVRFISTDQWAFAAGAIGIINRDGVATNMLLGQFAAESLLLAEAGNKAGAIQIAGTTNMYQIPYFVAACDYTVIGEELFAAGAQFSQNPTELGSLVGEDWAKIAAVALMVLGVLTSTFGSSIIVDLIKR